MEHTSKSGETLPTRFCWSPPSHHQWCVAVYLRWDIQSASIECNPFSLSSHCALGTCQSMPRRQDMRGICLCELPCAVSIWRLTVYRSILVSSPQYHNASVPWRAGFSKAPKLWVAMYSEMKQLLFALDEEMNTLRYALCRCSGLTCRLRRVHLGCNTY